MRFMGSESFRHPGVSTTDIHLFNSNAANIYPKFRRNATCVLLGWSFVWVECQVAANLPWVQNASALVITAWRFQNRYQGGFGNPMIPGIQTALHNVFINGIGYTGYYVRRFKKYTQTLTGPPPMQGYPIRFWYHQSTRQAPGGPMVISANGAAGVRFGRLRLGGHIQEWRGRDG
ncbi:hypothetical protein C8R46DRAFT_1023650 [Mycena filopes]|nr:hypothetical protein C8R46DRAFT_1023650 [Mycena filopes]